jgi:hypothetical protein
MNRIEQGPLLLILSGILLLLAVVAYLINDAEDRVQTKARIERQAQAINHDQAERNGYLRARADLVNQQQNILDRLKRIEDFLIESNARRGAPRESRP